METTYIASGRGGSKEEGMVGVKVPPNESGKVRGVLKEFRQVKFGIFMGATIYVIYGKGGGGKQDRYSQYIDSLATENGRGDVVMSEGFF